MNFQVGDKVQLKSGGPDMEVTWLLNDGSGRLRCTWRDDDNTLRAAEFPEASLLGILPAPGTSAKQTQHDINVRHRKIVYRRRVNLFIVEVMAWVTFLELLSRRSVISVLPTVVGVLIGIFLCWVIDKLWDRYAS